MAGERSFDFEDRLVGFAASVARFCESVFGTAAGNYYANQLIRSGGSAALNYGEAQGANTNRDFVNKASIVLKELKESRVSLKILAKLNRGENSTRMQLLAECEELIAITATMIKNKK